MAEKIASVDNSRLFGTSFAELFLGKTTTQDTSGGSSTTTVTEGASSDSVSARIKTLLESSTGLASIAGQQRTAGLYNSSTNKLLVNDLVARATAQAEATQSSKTSTTTQAPSTTTNTVRPQVNSGTAFSGLAALQLAPQGLKDKVYEALGIKNPAAAGLAKTARSFGVPDIANRAKDSQAAYDAMDNAGLPVTSAPAESTVGLDLSTPAANGVTQLGTETGIDLGNTLATTIADDATASTTAELVGSLVTSGVADAASGAAVDLGLGLDLPVDLGTDELGGEVTDWIKGLFSFAEGGLVNSETLKKKKKLSGTELTSVVEIPDDLYSPGSSLSYAVDRGSSGSVASSLGSFLGSSNSSSSKIPVPVPNSDNYGDRENSTLGESTGTTGLSLGNFGMSALGLSLGPAGSLAMLGLQALTGTKSVPAQIISDLITSIKDSLSLDQDPSTKAAPVEGMTSVVNGNPMSVPTGAPIGTIDLSQKALDALSPSNSGTSGESSQSSDPSAPDGTFNSGGKVKSDGTDAIDNINIAVTGGEFIIDKKTTSALGADFFRSLQAIYNPQALASQMSKGRM